MYPKESNKDTIRITVHNFTLGGTFKLSAQNPETGEYHTTEEDIDVLTVPDVFHEIVDWYWEEIVHSSFELDRTFYDADGIEVTREEDAHKAVTVVYQLVTDKLLDAPSMSNLLVIKNTSSEITVELPN